MQNDKISLRNAPAYIVKFVGKCMSKVLFYAVFSGVKLMLYVYKTFLK